MARLVLAAVLAIPLGLDLYMPVPEDNPITEEKIELGRRLFIDRRLSRDGTISCASCHDPERAFSDGRPVAVGVFGPRGRRNAPALINRGYGRAFFWDGRAATLEEQVLQPIQDPNEMDMTLAEVSARSGCRPKTMSRALASYVRSILSGNSPFDRYVNGDRRALSAEQQAGPPGLSRQGQLHGLPRRPEVHRRALPQHRRRLARRPAARRGTVRVTRKTADRGAFKTPTLREVARTAPYMHDGSLVTLDEVIDYYDRGGNRGPDADLGSSALATLDGGETGTCRLPALAESHGHPTGSDGFRFRVTAAVSSTRAGSRDLAIDRVVTTWSRRWNKGSLFDRAPRLDRYAKSPPAQEHAPMPMGDRHRKPAKPVPEAHFVAQSLNRSVAVVPQTCHLSGC